MDNRIRKWIENEAGLPFEMFPDEGIKVCVSEARTDEPKHRLLAQRVVGKNGTLVTGIPRVVKAVKDRVVSMTSLELFSPHGITEIKRALSPDDAKYLDEIYGIDYFIGERENFHTVKSMHKATALKKKDIPHKDFDLRMGERRSHETDDFTWAFACYHNDPNIPATRLTEYGSRCASVAVIFWKNDDIAGFGVATEELFQNQGYALAVVSAGTQWILDQHGVALYGAYANNIASLRIPARLGFTPIHSSFSA
jgi:RimJ/RimL family protein N-acetyltransferase